MENNEMTNRGMPAAVKVLIGILGGASISGLLLYLGAFAILPTLLVFEAFVVGAIVYGFAGVYGAAAMCLTAEIGMYITGGPIACGIMLTAFVLPYTLYVYLCEKRTAFFKTFEYVVFALGAGVMLSLVLVSAISGSDIGKLISDMMYASIESLTEAGQQALADIYASVYAAQGLAIDTSDPAKLLASVAESMENMTKLVMPLMLISIVVENAVLGTIIGGFIRVKRHVAGSSYVPISGWRLPARVTIGLILFVVVGAVLSKVQGVQGEVVYVTAIGTCVLACLYQTVASMYDKLSQIGIRFIFRILWIVFLLIGFSIFPLIYGALSALFGSHGLVRQLRGNSGKPDSSDSNQPEF